MLTLNIDTENAAFDGRDAEAELARILRKLADQIETGLTDIDDGERSGTGFVYDINGNKTGTWAASIEAGR